MAQNSKIEWTDHTFNPWIGCTKVSPGCANCYAESDDKRRKWTAEGWGKGKPRKRTSIANWKQPLKWDREWKEANTTIQTADRPRVFCASLADWLDDEVPIEWLVDLLMLIYQTQNLYWLLLTKRPQNWLKRMRWAFDFMHDREARGWLESWMAAAVTGPIAGIPPDNVWIGTTVEDQTRADERIPHLLEIPAKVRFLSCEPLLGPVDLMDYLDPIDGGYVGRSFIDWVICGGESGPYARPMHPKWAEKLRDDCEDSGVPFLFKQWGEWLPGPDHQKCELPGETQKNVQTWMRDDGEMGAVWLDSDFEWQNWTGDPGEDGERVAVINRVGKKAAGRKLDGGEHNGFPTL
jgi:protein gp37